MKKIKIFGTVLSKTDQKSIHGGRAEQSVWPDGYLHWYCHNHYDSDADYDFCMKVLGEI
ncbi:hypothetical protein SAMN04487910_0573 [Aquimarina amphilecti]|uniref:Uncharacterized protein n=1 Tax=Aquimarina amphilecti TaxID=1038014 RepID=A0A1H7H5Y9_AQUAM|nr:hypothetical protein [Aquimarina amphilecti]SEK45816.1 hypothetical protein SAMN04487910_0573 [Aquimarina amphilecti]